jgi:predicted RNA-binding Zn-ribbon protein involved in translation (DUF1610 family)
MVSGSRFTGMSDLESHQLSIATSLYPAIPANHEYEIEEFILPKEGEVKDWDIPDAECGKTKYTEKCPEDSSCDFPVRLIPWDCGRYECPVCGDRAITRGAMQVRNKVWATLQLMKKAFPFVNWMVSSVIISAPPEIYDLDFDEQHHELRKALKGLGAKGVAAIYHRWRYRDMITGEIHQEIPWREYVKNPDRFKRVLGVHWHCFVIGRMVDPDTFYDATGWVYKKMKSESTNSWELTQSDIYRISHYALSHTAISTSVRRHATHYYGYMWRSSVLEKWYDQKPIMCPKCNHQRVLRTEWHNWVAGVDTFGLEEPAVKLVCHRKWVLRGHPGVEWTDWNSNELPPDELDGGLDFSGYDAPVKEVEVVDLDDM